VILRSALLSELGVPASRIEEASMTHDKEKHPELFLRPLAVLDDYRAVLHLLGWGEPDIQEALSLDLDALAEARPLSARSVNATITLLAQILEAAADRDLDRPQSRARPRAQGSASGHRHERTWRRRNR
jgi:hypothetical protein